MRAAVLCAAVAAVGACSPAPSATLGRSSTVPTPDPVAPVITPETPVVTQPEAPPTVPEPEPATQPTPDPSGLATHSHQAEASGWAIPEYIVMCESGGSWNAYNPSGAAGPYQLMPEHFGDDARNHSQAEQHAMAAKLWAGGAGARNWAECL